MLYFPNAIKINNDNTEEPISVCEGCCSVEDAIGQFSIWEDYYNWKLGIRWVEVYEGDKCIDNIPIKSLVEIIAEWKAETGIEPYQETVAIHRVGDTLYIITQKPGMFIVSARVFCRPEVNVYCQ